jgi:hypothetical protein
MLILTRRFDHYQKQPPPLPVADAAEGAAPRVMDRKAVEERLAQAAVELRKAVDAKDFKLVRPSHTTRPH